MFGLALISDASLPPVSTLTGLAAIFIIIVLKYVPSVTARAPAASWVIGTISAVLVVTVL